MLSFGLKMKTYNKNTFMYFCLFRKHVDASFLDFDGIVFDI